MKYALAILIYVVAYTIGCSDNDSVNTASPGSDTIYVSAETLTVSDTVISKQKNDTIVSKDTLYISDTTITHDTISTDGIDTIIVLDTVVSTDMITTSSSDTIITHDTLIITDTVIHVDTIYGSGNDTLVTYDTIVAHDTIHKSGIDTLGSGMGGQKILTLREEVLDDWSFLSEMSDLEILNLYSTNIDQRGVEAIPSMEHLQKLYLTVSPQPEMESLELYNLPSLRELTAYYSNTWIHDIKNLKSLRCGGTNNSGNNTINDRAVIKNLPSLTKLNYISDGYDGNYGPFNNNINGDYCELENLPLVNNLVVGYYDTLILKNLPSLTDLAITLRRRIINDTVYYSSYAEFSDLPNLEYLDLKVSRQESFTTLMEHIRSLSTVKRVTLEQIEFHKDTAIDVHDLSGLANLQNVEALEISRFWNITNINSFPPMPSLKDLRIYFNQHMNNFSGIESLAPNLESLTINLTNDAVYTYDFTLPKLAEFKSLKNLYISGLIDPNDLSPLSGSTTLERVNLGFQRYVESFEFIRNYTSLRYLSISCKDLSRLDFAPIIEVLDSGDTLQHSNETDNLSFSYSVIKRLEEKGVVVIGI